MVAKRTLATVALAALTAACTVQSQDGPGAGSYPALAGADACAAVTPAMVGATSASGKWVPAAEGLPAFCEVTTVMGPATGSVITSVYRLPDNWNGKMLGLGGGGWSGQLALLPPRTNVPDCQLPDSRRP